MAEKKDNKIIFWILGIGTIGYGVYQWYKNRSVETPSTPVYTPPDKDINGRQYTTYEKRVMALQQLLGVKIDGIAGNQTNGELNEFYKGNLSFGNISESNIEKYITAMETKTTPYHLQMKAEAVADANANSQKKVLAIIEAYKANPNQFIQLNPAKMVGGAFEVYKVTFNSAANDWEKIGVVRLVANRTTRDGYFPYAYSPKWNALILRVNDGGKYIYTAINPDFVQVTF
jgi:hypothetical protein